MKIYKSIISMQVLLIIYSITLCRRNETQLDSKDNIQKEGPGIGTLGTASISIAVAVLKIMTSTI